MRAPPGLVLVPHRVYEGINADQLRQSLYCEVGYEQANFRRGWKTSTVANKALIEGRLMTLVQSKLNGSFH